jgi:putative toxin-antitoxin system antitoxin component (TIGR02293 family)
MAYPAVERVTQYLGGASVLLRDIRSLADLEQVVHDGLPFGSLRLVSGAYPAAERERIETLVVPRTTRLRRERSGRLSVDESERLERVARLTALASHVLETDIAGRDFLLTPHPLLGDQTPIDLAQTDLGARRVEAILWNLEFALPV